MRYLAIVMFLAIFLAAKGAYALAAESGWEPNPGKQWVHEFEYGVETVSFRAGGYDELVESPTAISFRVTGLKIASPAIEKIEGAAVSEMLLKPDGNSTLVTLKLRGIADGFSINAAPRSKSFPNSASVVVGFTGLRAPTARNAASNGGGDEYPVIQSVSASRGDYELPEFERKYRYSDTLITLKTSGASVIGIIEFLSFVSGVSIVLDPYWDQEPTGTGRPPLSGGGPGGAGTGGGPGTGYRGLGTGLITVDLKEVPFDLALDLILTSAGLVYFEIG